jgi:predicted nucleic acid-binding protein
VKVFVDTSAFLAVLDADDSNHQAAKGVWEKLLAGGTSLVCSNYVLVETLALVQTRLGMAAVQTFQHDIEPLLEVAWIGEAGHRAGVAALLTANRRRLSFVDCVSFQTMRQLDLDTAFAFDQHFDEQGFERLL